MGKSLGDYNIEQSSSADIKNIKWTQKNPKNTLKKKKVNKRNTSASNIIYTQKTKIVVEKEVFKVTDTDKSKKKKTDKQFQSSSASNCKIKQGFSRPGR